MTSVTRRVDAGILRSDPLRREPGGVADLARGAILVSFGREKEAPERYRLAVDASRKAEDMPLELIAHSNLSRLAAEFGDFERAVPALRELGHPGFLLLALARAGDHEGAREYRDREGHRVGVPIRMEVHYELGKQSGDPAETAEARRLLDFELEHTPERYRDGMQTRVPRNVEILRG